MKTYEVQLGIIADGARDGTIDYDSPKIILVEADHSLEIEEVEAAFGEAIRELGCDCVYGITELEDWELEVYPPSVKYCNFGQYVRADRSEACFSR